MSRPGKYGLNGIAERSRTTGKTYVQHRAYVCRTAVFAVFEAKSAVAVFFVVFMRTAFSAAASLADSRRLFHDCFDGVEGG